MIRDASPRGTSRRPPRFAEWLMGRLLACESREALLGDLAEEYALRHRAAARGIRPRLWYWKQLLTSVAPSRRQRAELRAHQHSRSPGKGMAPMNGISNDLRSAWRALSGAPGFSAATIITIVIGIGLTTVMFTVVYGVLARPLPYEDPDELVVLLRGDAGSEGADLPVSYPAYEFWRDNNRAFEQLAAYDRYLAVTLRLGDDPESVPAARVSANYFAMLGVTPLLGRGFQPHEDEVGAETLLILSHELLVTRFGADPNVVGRAVRLSRSDGRVIGVLPEDFRDIYDRPRMWLSMAGETRRPNTNSLYMIGRVREGLSAAQIAEDAERVRAELAAESDGIEYGSIVPVALHTWRVGDIGGFLRILAAAVVLVVLIVVANLSNLALVHTTTRARELAVRAAIGAGRGRIVRLLLVEAALLGFIGALLALLLAWQATALFLRFAPEVPRQAEIGVHMPVILFAVLAGVGVSVAATVVALLAAWRGGLAGALRPGGRHADAGVSGHKTQGALAVAQLGLALALLLAVGLLLRSLAGMQAVDTGFVARDALIVELSAPSTYAAGDERRGFYEQLMERVRALPGVDAVGAVSFIPFTGWSTSEVRPEGMEEAPVDELPAVEIDAASPGFFAAMGTPILRGRDFRDSDDGDAPKVAIVNRALAERFWPGEDPIGKRLSDDEGGDDPAQVLTVVGMIENVSARGVTVPVEPKFYTAYRQSDYWWPFGMTLVLRSSTPPAQQAQPVREVLRAMVPEPPLAVFTTLEDWLAEEFAGIRLQTTLFGIFAVVAVVLASVGLYGVIASGVARRRREIGVRMALGADAGRVLRQVITSGARIAVAGTLLGIPLALLLASTMESMLFGVSTLDPPALIGTVLLLNGVCILACWLPARRASRVAPLEAMRE